MVSADRCGAMPPTACLERLLLDHVEFKQPIADRQRAAKASLRASVVAATD
jgi:hypothetical protein